MADYLRYNAAMQNDVAMSYDTHLYSTDHGMWTVVEIVKRPIAKVANEAAARELIKKLSLANTVSKSMPT